MFDGRVVKGLHLSPLFWVIVLGRRGGETARRGHPQISVTNE